MPLRLGLRFVAEAAFLIAVAVAAAVLSFSTPAIVAVMAGAWLLVAAVEWGVSRRAAGRRLEPAEEPVGLEEPGIVPARVPFDPLPEPEPLAEPIPPVAVGALPPDVREALAEGTVPPLPEPLSPATELLEEVEEPPEPEPEPELEPEPVEEAPSRLVVVPEPEPEAEPEAVPAPEPEPEPEPVRAEVVSLAAWGDEPREWNLWDLERALRASSGDDVERHEERSYLLMYLRDFAGPDGSLPANFDRLVRESFGDLLGSVAR